MAFKGDLEAVVLGVLSDAPMHGYEISRRIRELDEGALNAREGKLYPMLHRLEREALVEANWVPQDGKPPRKVYRLTLMGRLRLEEHRDAFRAFTRTMGDVLLPAGSERRIAHG